MSGIVNSTGARSGIIGTTVGTPAGGKLLQWGSDDYDTEPALVKDTDNDAFEVIDATNFKVTLTKLSATSKFFIEVFLAGCDAGDWSCFDIYRNISGVSTNNSLSGNPNGFAHFYTSLTNDGQCAYHYVDPPTDIGVAITYAPSARTTHTSHDWNINDSGMSSRITVMEIEV